MLQINALKKSYPDFVLDLNLEIKDETITGIVGPNGSGKTTLIKSILGLIESDRMDGNLFNHRLDQLSISDKEKIGVVFSDSGFCEQFDLEQISGILKALYKKFDQKFFDQLVLTFELARNKKISGFSSGQKNLVKLIAALSHQAEFLILDEPTNGLDVLVREKVLRILAEYSSDYHASILITSHISSDLERFCDDLYLIKKGKELLYAQMDQIEDSYGVIKTEKLPDSFDYEYILATRKTPYGYQLLTSEKQFFKENYPELVIEKPTLDELQLIMYEGEKS